MGKRQQREKDVKARAGLTDGGRTWRAGTSQRWARESSPGWIKGRMDSWLEGAVVRWREGKWTLLWYQHSPDILREAGHQWRLMGVRLGLEPSPKLYSLTCPRSKGWKMLSFRIRTQVFHLPSSVVSLLKDILNFVQNMTASPIWDTRPIIFHQVPWHELFWLLSTICPPFLWVLCKSKVGWICGCETHGCVGQTIPQHSVCKGPEQQQSLVSVGAPGTIPCGYWETITNYFKVSSSIWDLLEKYWGFTLSSFKILIRCLKKLRIIFRSYKLRPPLFPKRRNEFSNGLLISSKSWSKLLMKMMYPFCISLSPQFFCPFRLVSSLVGRELPYAL